MYKRQEWAGDIFPGRGIEWIRKGVSVMNPTTERPDRELLAKAAAQAGLDPDRVLEQLDRGAFDQALRKLNPHGSEMIAEVLQSPDAMAQLLRQPGPQALLRDLCRR